MVPYFYAIRMHYMATFTALSVTVLPVTYVIGTMFTLSLFSIWLDFRISNKRAGTILIISAFLLIFLDAVINLIIICGSDALKVYLNDKFQLAIYFNWLLNYPVVFIIPGAMLFFGFNRKPQPSAETTQTVQETMPI